MSATERLFSYGTLQLPTIQLANFGRLLTGTPDSLIGYEPVPLPIDDQQIIESLGQTHYVIARFTGRASDVVSGTVFEVSFDEIKVADAYEEEPYTRIKVTLASGIDAWVYVHAAS